MHPAAPVTADYAVDSPPGEVALVFLLLSADEAAALHEMTTIPLRDFFQASGILHYTWVILGAGFVVAFVIAFIPFLAHLPRRTRWLFLISGALFVGGAVVMESLGGSYLGYVVEDGSGQWAVSERPKDLLYTGLSMAEELMEMLGVVIFIYSLLDYISVHLGGITLRVAKTSRPEG